MQMTQFSTVISVRYVSPRRIKTLQRCIKLRPIYWAS